MKKIVNNFTSHFFLFVILGVPGRSQLITDQSLHFRLQKKLHRFSGFLKVLACMKHTKLACAGLVGFHGSVVSLTK